MYKKSLKIIYFIGKVVQKVHVFSACVSTAAVGFPGLPGRKTLKFLYSRTSYLFRPLQYMGITLS